MASKENSYLILVTNSTDVQKLEKDYNEIAIKDSILQDEVHYQRKDVEVNWGYYNQLIENISTYKETEECKTIARVYIKLQQSIATGTLSILFDLDLPILKYKGDYFDIAEVTNFIIEKDIELTTDIPLEGGDESERVTVTAKQLQKHISYIGMDFKAEEGVDFITDFCDYKVERIVGTDKLDFTNAPKLLSLPINYKTKDYINFEKDKTLISFKLCTENSTDVFLNKLLTIVNKGMGAEVVDLQMNYDIITEVKTFYFNILCEGVSEERTIRLVLNLINENINQDEYHETTLMSINIEREVDKGVTSKTKYYFLTGVGYGDRGNGICDELKEYKEHLTQSSVEVFGYKTFI
ncbi:hypothetical protein P9X10_02655 [Bacillus cereus]|nr:hypothetical protein [Bacillus cereus]